MSRRTTTRKENMKKENDTQKKKNETSGDEQDTYHQTPETGRKLRVMELVSAKVNEIINKKCAGKTSLSSEDVEEMWNEAQEYVTKLYK